MKNITKFITKPVSKLDKFIVKCMKNNMCANTLRALLVVYAVFVNRVPDQMLSLYDNFLCRLAFAAFIVYMVFVDPITALLLAAVFVLSVQERNYRKSLGNNVANNVANNVVNNVANNDVNNVANNDVNNVANNQANNNLARPGLEIKEATTTNVPYEQTHPASQTLTDNLVESGQGSDFTSTGQLKAAQNNLISGVDPDQGVKTFTNQLGPQGLNIPGGYDLEGAVSSKF